MKKINAEFIRLIPKADLHVHLDGSLRLSTLIELAQKDGVELPRIPKRACAKKYLKTI